MTARTESDLKEPLPKETNMTDTMTETRLPEYTIGTQRRADYLSAVLAHNTPDMVPFTVEETSMWGGIAEPKDFVIQLFRLGWLTREEGGPGVAYKYSLVPAAFEAADLALADWDERHPNR